MHVEILVSGSKGNVTAIRAAESFFLIDCGKPYRWTLARLNNRLPEAILLTHEHHDHATSVKQFLSRGVDFYMTAGTREQLKLSARHNLHTIEKFKPFKVAGVEVTAIDSVHDAREPVNFILQDAQDRVLFVTDTGAVPEVSGDFTKIFIEANYSIPALAQAEYFFQQRISMYHLSIESAEKFLAKYPAAEVTLLHVSKRHGNEEEFYERIKR